MHSVILLWFSVDVIKLWTTTKEGLYLVDPINNNISLIFFKQKHELNISHSLTNFCSHKKKKKDFSLFCI